VLLYHHEYQVQQHGKPKKEAGLKPTIVHQEESATQKMQEPNAAESSASEIWKIGEGS